jgi:sugar lactone lactonase YvrE
MPSTGEPRIYTVAGGPGPSGVPARSIGQRPSGIAVLGDVAYVSDSANDIVWAVNLRTGIETRVAGDGVMGWAGDGGPAVDAELNDPTGLAIGPGPSLYISDSGNNRVQRVNLATGIMTTVAGNGALSSADEPSSTTPEPATKVSLASPEGLAISPGADVLYIADTLANQVVALDLSTGVLWSVAGDGSYGYSGDGGPAAAAAFAFPEAVAVYRGTLYVADTDNSVVRAVSLTTKTVTTVAGDGLAGYSPGPKAGTPSGVAQAVSNATSARLSYPAGLAAGHGVLYISDHGSDAIQALTLSNGSLSTIAGDGEPGYTPSGGLADRSELDGPTAIALEGERLLVADTGNLRLRSIDLVNSTVRTVAGNGTLGSSSSTGMARSVQLSVPSSVAVSSSGVLYIADTGDGLVQAVDLQNGRIKLLAGRPEPVGAQAAWGHPLTLRSLGLPARQVALAAPAGLALSPGGHRLFVAEQLANRVLEVDLATGRLTTVAGDGMAGAPRSGSLATRTMLDQPTGVALSPDGKVLYVADMLANRVEAVDLRTERISEIAGPGTATALAFPWGLAVDRSGDLYIADKDANRVQLIVAKHQHVSASTKGITVAGEGLPGYSRGGGNPRRALLDQPTGIALGPHGSLYVADGGNDRIRRVEDPLGYVKGRLRYPRRSLPRRLGRPGSPRPGSFSSSVEPVPRVVAVPSLPAATKARGAANGGSALTRADKAGPTHVAVMGDSVALTLAVGLAQAAKSFGLAIEDDGVLGCGVLSGGEILNSGVVYPPTPLCEHWQAIWERDLVSQSPSVVAILIGRWEAVDREVDGRWSHVGEGAFDNMLFSSLEEAVRLASARGARVVLLGAPYYQLSGDPSAGVFPETNPIRVDELNSVLSVLPMSYPEGEVSYFGLGGLLDPGGHWSFVVDGVVSRYAEGVHVTPQGGLMLAPYLLPVLKQS